MDASKAWDKLAAHSLPFEHAWVLKLVQSAVRIRSALALEQTRSVSTFTWADARWTQQQVQGAMLSVDDSFDPALTHLGHGLRALAKSTSLSFAVRFLTGESIMWNGQGFQQGPSVPAATEPFTVAVSHFELDESTGFLSTATFRAAERRASIGRVLSSRCHWAPVRVTLDGRSINNIFSDPTFGGSNLRQPLCLIRVPPQLPYPTLEVQADPRVIPKPSIFTDAEVPTITPDWYRFQEALTGLSQPCFAIGMVSAILVKVSAGKNSTVTKTGTVGNAMAWISDGVEVARESLPFRPRSAALLVACSAEGLGTDISGLIPIHSAPKAERRTAALRAIRRGFPDTRDEQADYDIEGGTDPANTTMLVIGGLSLLFNPLVGAAILTFGGLSWTSLRSRNAAIQKAIKEGFEGLAEELEKRVPYEDEASTVAPPRRLEF
jgi:hypothetical protein